MSDIASLNQHQKKALVIQLYEQGKTRRQIAEVAHMSFKDIADVRQLRYAQPCSLKMTSITNTLAHMQQNLFSVQKIGRIICSNWYYKEQLK